VSLASPHYRAAGALLALAALLALPPAAVPPAPVSAQAGIDEVMEHEPGPAGDEAAVVPPASPSPTAGPAATSTPVPPARARRPAGQFIYGAVLGNPEATVNQARAAGLTHFSAYVPWRTIEPSRGHFVFEQMESWGKPQANDLTNVINAARAAGLKVVFRLDEPPEWAGGKPYRVSPSDVENVVHHVVRYGKGTIAYVEVFNEMNLPFEWGASPVDPAAYARLLEAAKRGARRADTGVQVVSAAVAPRTGGGGGSMEDVEWLDRLYAAGAKESFDLAGMHAYLGNHAPEADPACVPMCLRTVELQRAVMERHGDAAKQVLITEIGALEQATHDLGAYEWMELPADRRAEHLVNALQYVNARYPWVVGALVFNLDFATTPWVPASSPMHWFSLVNADRSPRPAYLRLREARASGALP
jgi:hypothetical protein